MAKKLSAAAGYRLKCPICMEYFSICDRCYRGHRYCSSVCSKAARRDSLRSANKRYRQTPSGRRKRRLSQDRYRKRQKNVNDHTYKESPQNLRRSRQDLGKNQTQNQIRHCVMCRSEVSFYFQTIKSQQRRATFGSQYRNGSSDKENVLCRAPPD